VARRVPARNVFRAYDDARNNLFSGGQNENCVPPANGDNFAPPQLDETRSVVRMHQPPLVLTQMPDDPAQPKPCGNSYERLMELLERGGHTELLAAVKANRLSAYAACCEVGYRKRREPTGRGSENARKRRDWAIYQAYRDAKAS
jgi:hypothetical protein